MLNFSVFTLVALVTSLPTTTSTLMNQIDQQQGEPTMTMTMTMMQKINTDVPDLVPNFTLGLKNMSVPVTRDVTFTCHVRNIGQFRVRHTSYIHIYIRSTLYI